ncbi:hypothetical protein IFM89_003755 [Coptis chinensis]|uniref:RNA methyltransferase n=1 Tax=Coptis chinensis TaxID=261450 RepID=A0A835LYZ6_9MAGN|nr:hypothetical protein IFM89_003755 [Coptis chinensis]
MENKEKKVEESKKRKRKEVAVFGNYRNYYGYRLAGDMKQDPRFKVFKKEWFEGKDCFDIGCNQGLITIEIGLLFLWALQGYDGATFDPRAIFWARGKARASILSRPHMKSKTASSDLDSQGHRVEPDHPEITEAVDNIDKIIGKLIHVIENSSFLKIWLHGLKFRWTGFQSYSPLLAIRPPASVSLSEVVKNMTEGLSSSRVSNGKYLKVFLKEDLPDRLHYAASERISPIIGLLNEGFMVEQRNLSQRQCAGAHGYENAYFSMRTIFIGHGPRFARGHKIPSFESVEIYNLITSILNIQGASNNGTASFVNSVLLPNSYENGATSFSCRSIVGVDIDYSLIESAYWNLKRLSKKDSSSSWSSNASESDLLNRTEDLVELSVPLSLNDETEVPQKSPFDRVSFRKENFVEQLSGDLEKYDTILCIGMYGLVLTIYVEMVWFLWFWFECDKMGPSELGR